MRKTVTVGGASGFWGDSNEGARQLLNAGGVDFLVFDYLAELTLSILARNRARDPNLGYATDFVREALPSILPDVSAGRVRVLANAGGMNPQACADALRQLADRQGLPLQVGVVEGDDLLHLEQELRDRDIRDMAGARPLPGKIVSLNAYLGAFPIARALDLGAQVVITGRCVDSALALAPLIHSFGWTPTDFDKLAGGSLMGHMIECGTQATGGLFTDWLDVPGRENIGFPIAECHEDGSFEFFKPAGTGGLVNPLVVAEQMLYEVHDPANYLLPDVTCDIAGVTVTAVARDRVRFSPATGRAPGASYKTSATYDDGYRSSVMMTIVGADACEKAETIGAAIVKRCEMLFRARNLGAFTETNIEVLGGEKASFGSQANCAGQREVVLRVAARHDQKEALEIFAREIAPFGTSGVPGTTGMGGRPKVQPVFRLLSLLVPKDLIVTEIEVGQARERIKPVIFGEEPALRVAEAGDTVSGGTSADHVAVPLSALAVGRSGDKGDISNIAVICRKPEYYPILERSLTPDMVAQHMSHLVQGDVQRFAVPGIHAMNFVLHQALGGGGAASLRNDPLGKTFAQILLQMEVAVPLAIAEAIKQDRSSGQVPAR